MKKTLPPPLPPDDPVRAEIERLTVALLGSADALATRHGRVIAEAEALARSARSSRPKMAAVVPPVPGAPPPAGPDEGSGDLTGRFAALRAKRGPAG